MMIELRIFKLPAGRGLVWIKQGWQLILRNPLPAASLAMIGALMVIAALYVPAIGPLLALLLMPVVIAGYMRVCRALEEDEALDIRMLFAGFDRNTRQLAAIGGYAMAGMLLVSMAMVAFGGPELAGLMEQFHGAQDMEALLQTMSAASGRVGAALMVGLGLGFVLMLAMQYAPMLVFFSDVPPLVALRASLAGSLRNIVPYTLYSLVLQGLALLLSYLPFGLGMIVLLPLGFTSLYVSYRNIFPFPGETPPAN